MRTSEWTSGKSSWMTLMPTNFRSREIELTEVFTADRYGFEFDTNSTYPIAIGISMDFADYFNFGRQQAGKQRSLTLESTLRPQSNFSIELDSGYAQSLDFGRCDLMADFFVSFVALRHIYSHVNRFCVCSHKRRGRVCYQPKFMRTIY